MSLISSSIPNFVNGVSQQPFTLRLTSQGESQENGLSTVSSGLRKRPPTEMVAKLSSTPLTDSFVHTINRDGTEQYQVILTNGDLKVYDLLGVQKTVNFTDKTYLSITGTATDSFALTTVADYTFITNKKKIVLEAPTVSPTKPYEALFNVKLGNYGKTYSLLIDDAVVATYATPDGTNASESVDLSTDSIASNLYALLLETPSIVPGDPGTPTDYASAPWVTALNGCTIYIKNTTTDFTVSIKDGFNGFAMVAIKDTLQKFTDLPSNPHTDGFIVQITGDQASSFDNYWIKFSTAGSGTWKETVAPGIKLGLDPTTMPHQLVREADGTFTFKPATWTNRIVGDIKSNPDPSFLGSTINDVFFFQNRLGFLSDENFIMSETGKYFNPYRTTVVTLLDSDPVDINAATNKVAILTHAVGFNKQLLLFSLQQQFLVDSIDIMSPKKVPIKPTTDFYVNTRARPVSAGRNVYFTMDKGSYSSVREYYADLNNLTNDATDITSHVPTYVPAGVIKIAAGVSEDVLVMLSENDRSKLYIYKYYFSGNEKLQSSWSTFSFAAGSTILNCEFIKSVLYLVISRADGVYLEKMDFSIGATTTGEPYHVHLDRKVQIPTTALSYDGTHTTINSGAIGYLPSDGNYMAVTKGSTTVKPGLLANVLYGTGVTKLLGDFTSTALSMGQKYLFKYGISPLTVRLQSYGQTRAADTEGRTQIRKIAFNHATTGYYQVKVTPLARDTYTYVFTAKVMGTPTATIGTESMDTGRFAAPVVSQNTTVKISVESDMPLPVALFSADWEGYYVKRSRPV